MDLLHITCTTKYSRWVAAFFSSDGNLYTTSTAKQAASMPEVLSTQDEQLASLPRCFSLYHRQTSANKMLLRPRLPGLYDINWKSSAIFRRTYALLLLVQFKVVSLFSTLLRAMKLKLFTCCNYPKRPQNVVVFQNKRMYISSHTENWQQMMHPKRKESGKPNSPLPLVALTG